MNIRRNQCFNVWWCKGKFIAKELVAVPQNDEEISLDLSRGVQSTFEWMWGEIETGKMWFGSQKYHNNITMFSIVQQNDEYFQNLCVLRFGTSVVND